MKFSTLPHLEKNSESSVPLQNPENGHNRLKRWIMIGDHHQLPPVIKNMAFQKFSNMEQSLFTRFVRLGVPTVDLDAQGRARPRLAYLHWVKYAHNTPNCWWMNSLFAACATCTTGATRSWGTWLMSSCGKSTVWPTLDSIMTSSWLMWETSMELASLSRIPSSIRCVLTHRLITWPLTSVPFLYLVFFSSELGGSWVCGSCVHVHATSGLPCPQDLHPHHLQWPEAPDPRCHCSEMPQECSHWSTSQGLNLGLFWLITIICSLWLPMVSYLIRWPQWTDTRVSRMTSFSCLWSRPRMLVISG